MFFYRKSRFQGKISVSLYKTVFFNYTSGFSIHNTILFYRKPRFQSKSSAFLYKTVFFLTIQPYFRYIILFSSIENLVFKVKFQSLFIKPFFFNYTTGFSIHNTIFFHRKPRFNVKFKSFYKRIFDI